jgi:hypothetical protein
MNKDSQTPIGDLSGTETELTVPTPEMVTQRAREIARIEERNPDKFTQEDWDQARFELTGVKASASWEDLAETAAESLSERGSIPGESGTQTPRVAPKDEALLEDASSIAGSTRRHMIRW